MYLHTHNIAQHEGEDPVETYVLHLSRAESEALALSLINTLEQNPDQDSFAVTLGKAVANDEEPHEVQAPVPPQLHSGLILPGSGGAF